MRNKTSTHQSGFTLLIAMVVTATLLLVSTGIVSVAVKQAFLASAGRESQFAFYAADTGIECALFWDVRNPTGVSAFSATSTTNITCNEQSFSVGGSSGPQTFSFDFDPADDGSGEPYCTTVTVTKTGYNTKIESLGYNTCDLTNRRRVERAVRVSY